MPAKSKTLPAIYLKRGKTPIGKRITPKNFPPKLAKKIAQYRFNRERKALLGSTKTARKKAPKKPWKFIGKTCHFKTPAILKRLVRDWASQANAVIRCLQAYFNAHVPGDTLKNQWISEGSTEPHVMTTTGSFVKIDYNYLLCLTYTKSNGGKFRITLKNLEDKPLLVKALELLMAYLQYRDVRIAKNIVFREELTVSGVDKCLEDRLFQTIMENLCAGDGLLVNVSGISNKFAYMRSNTQPVSGFVKCRIDTNQSNGLTDDGEPVKVRHLTCWSQTLYPVICAAKEFFEMRYGVGGSGSKAIMA